jgi:4-azaleucine resistance transporter AzlC
MAPLLPAVVAFSASFGVLSHAAGMSRVASIVMSATTFAGSAQVAVVSILGTGGTVVAAIAAALLLNARYGAIGVSVGAHFEGGPLRRILQSQVIVDESWALTVRPDGSIDRRALIGAGGTLWVFWVGGTALGAFVSIGDPGRLGLDGAFPALFLALLVPQLRTRVARLAALLGAVIAFALIPLTPAGVPVIAAACACLLGWRRA